jgi:hypothetical protein
VMERPAIGHRQSRSVPCSRLPPWRAVYESRAAASVTYVTVSGSRHCDLGSKVSRSILVCLGLMLNRSKQPRRSATCRAMNHSPASPLPTMTLDYAFGHVHFAEQHSASVHLPRM